jgi:hypothetical protein
METPTFSLGHPVHRILHHAISFLGGFVKDSVYVPPLPTSIQELRDGITHTLQAITADMLQFDYRVYVCRVTRGTHIEGL